ncbi:hypothetical protein Hte_007982 [Hypoxylon texense]
MEALPGDDVDDGSLDDDDEDEGLDEVADSEFARAQVTLIENSGDPKPLSVAHVIITGHVVFARAEGVLFHAV